MVTRYSSQRPNTPRFYHPSGSTPSQPADHATSVLHLTEVPTWVTLPLSENAQPFQPCLPRRRWMFRVNVGLLVLMLVVLLPTVGRSAPAPAESVSSGTAFPGGVA